MKNNNPIIWFVTLPQLLLAGTLSVSLASRFHTGVLLILIISAIIAVASAVYAMIRRQKPDTVFLVILSVAGCLMLASSMLLLGGAATFTGYLTPKLIALLLCGVMSLYAVSSLAKSLEPEIDAGRYILALTALPIAWFIIFNIVTGIRLAALAIILIVTGALAVIFLLVRVGYSRAAKALASSGVQKPSLRVLFLIFSIGLPLICLILNAALDNLFGDFMSPWFFIIPVLNGALLLLSPFSDKRLGLLRFFLLSASLSYFVYFFVVFVPYMPLGIFGLLFYGLGVLIFAPVGAITMQLIELNRERMRLLPLWGGKRLILSFVLALLLIPAFLLTDVIGDRNNLENAMSYLETSEAVSGDNVNTNRLKRTLDNAPGTLEINRDMFFNFTTARNTPLLSCAYSKIALGGKVLTGSDIKQLRHLFFDEYKTSENRDITTGLTINENSLSDVRLIDVTTETTYDPDIGADRTWINLTLEGSEVNSEYVTVFNLPDGAYISDYYLYLGTVRKYGLLTDQRAAMAVYESIVRVRADPGMLRYVGDGMLELRVFPFPFAGRNVRHTGFEIIHSQSFEFALDDQTISVEATVSPEEVFFQGGVLLSGAVKQSLPVADIRDFSYYFVVDCSEDSLINYQLSLIDDYASMNNIADAGVIFASYNLTESTIEQMRTVPVTPKHGFNLALAIKTILTDKDDDTVPLIVFTSSNPAGALLPEHSSWPAKRFPESPYYYHLRSDLMLTPYAFDGNRIGSPVAAPELIPIRSYKDTFVRDDNFCEIVSRPGDGAFVITGNQYLDALAMDTAFKSQSSMDSRTSLMMLRASFRTHVLTKQTAFIVVETTEQEAELWRMQELLLVQQENTVVHEALDEPPMFLMVLTFAVFACVALFLHQHMRRRRVYR